VIAYYFFEDSESRTEEGTAGADCEDFVDGVELDDVEERSSNTGDGIAAGVSVAVRELIIPCGVSCDEMFRYEKGK